MDKLLFLTELNHIKDLFHFYQSILTEYYFELSSSAICMRIFLFLISLRVSFMITLLWVFYNIKVTSLLAVATFTYC